MVTVGNNESHKDQEIKPENKTLDSDAKSAAYKEQPGWIYYVLQNCIVRKCCGQVNVTRITFLGI